MTGHSKSCGYDSSIFGVFMQGAYPRALSTFCCLIAAFPCAAQGWESKPAFTATPDEILKAAAALPLRATFPAQELLEDTTIRLDAEGRRTVRYRYLFRINQDAAIAGWGTATAPWSPWFEEKPTIRARVITPDGKAHPLDPATIGEFTQEQSGSDMFSDRRELRAPLPKMAKGALAEVEIVSREHRPFARSGTRGRYALWQPVPVNRTLFSLEVPSNLPLRWKLAGFTGTQPKPQTVDGITSLRLDFGPADPHRQLEPKSVPDQDPRPFMLYTTCPSWDAAATDYQAIVETQLAGSDVKAWARDAAAPEGPFEQRLTRILMRLHKDVRYTGLEFGEASVVPRPPAETLKRGYGDCKDKATLLVAVLRELGIQAYVALLRTGPGLDQNPEFPGLSAFDHAIVHIPGPNPLWIDPTVPEARVGLLPIPDLGRHALVVAPAPSGGLQQTPQVTADQNTTTELREVFLADEGTARIVETTEAFGPAEISLRGEYSGAVEKQVRENLKTYVENTYKAKELGSVTFVGSTDLTLPFRLGIESLHTGIASTSWVDAAAALNYWPVVRDLHQILQQHPGKEAEEEATAEIAEGKEPPPRRTDLQLDAPYTTTHRWIIHPPLGFVADGLPPERSIQAGPAEVKLTFAVRPDHVVETTYRLTVPRVRWSPEEVNQARIALKTFGEEKIPFLAFHQEGEAHLSAGRHREALASFRQMQQAAPQKAVPLVRQARALLAAGFGEAARATARRALTLEPELALVHQHLGWILEHNAFGRRFRPGWDRLGAIEAYRKAIALQPSNREARHSLAILLEHDAHGVRYTRGKDLETAAAIYQGLIKEEKDETLQDSLTLCLAYSHRFQEARDLAQSREPGPRRNAWLLAMEACLQGIQGTLERSKTLFPDLTTRRATCLGAADVLVRFRKYTEAARLLQEGANGGTEMAQVRARGELLERVRLHESLSRDPKDPVAAARAILQSTMDTGWTYTQVEGRLSRAQRCAPVQEEFTRALQNRQDKLAQQQLPEDVLLDISLSLAEFAVDGDDTRGYMVHGLLSDQTPMTLFFTREEGAMHAVGNELTDLARQALWHADRGELEPARAWLDHMVEGTRRGTTEDPLSERPARRLWKKGHAGTLEEAKLVAASVLATKKGEARAYTCLKAAFSELANGPKAEAVAQALCEAAYVHKDVATMEQASKRLLSLQPASPIAHHLRVNALSRAERWAEAIETLDLGLKQRPEEPSLLSRRIYALQKAGRTEEMEHVIQDRVQRGKADASEYNNFAWWHVLRGQVTPRTLEYARKAIQGAGARSDAAHNTLAVVLAEAGRTQEALEMLRKSMTLREIEKATGADYYVLGRIAEHLGEHEVALNCYAQVKPDAEGNDEDETDCPAMARKRMEALKSANRS